MKQNFVDPAVLRRLRQDTSLSEQQILDRISLNSSSRHALGLDLVVFVMVRARHQNAKWIDTFRQHVQTLPGLIDFFRVGGEYDYILKIVTRDMNSYDKIYKQLIEKVDLDYVTSFFAMESIVENKTISR